MERADPAINERLGRISGGLLADSDEDVAETVTAPNVIENAGIFHAVWWSRDSALGPVLGSLWRNVPWLRSNWSALATLAIAAVVFGLLRSLSLARARYAAERVALEAVTRLRRSLHRQSLRLGPSDLLDQAGERVLGLFTNEAERVREGIALYVYRLGRHPIKLALLLTMALMLSWRDTLLCLVPLAGCWFFAHRERQRRASAYRLSADRARHELRLLAETLRKMAMS